MSLTEAARLTAELAKDPTSHTFAAVSGWEHPASREHLALLDLYDLTHQVAWAQAGGKGSRPKPLPRPWPDENTQTFGKGTALPIPDLAATLSAHRAAIDAESAA